MWNRYGNALKSIGVLLLLYLLLLPVSLSADDFLQDLTMILQDLETSLTSLETNWSEQRKALMSLSGSMESLQMKSQTLEEKLAEQSEQQELLSNIVIQQEETLTAYGISMEGLQNLLTDTERQLQRTKTLSHILAGGLAVSLLLVGISLLF